MTVEAGRHISLRIRLGADWYSIALDRVHQVVGYAALAGVADEYFLGWLTLHGEPVPVFDLTRIVCEEPTPEQFGSRIVVVVAGKESATRYVGLLAAGVTDTVATGEVEALPLEMYLPMVYTMIPPVPATV